MPEIRFTGIAVDQLSDGCLVQLGHRVENAVSTGGVPETGGAWGDIRHGLTEVLSAIPAEQKHKIESGDHRARLQMLLSRTKELLGEHLLVCTI